MVTERQVAALKALIDMSQDGTDMIKLVLFLLVDASECMSREVSVTLSEETNGYIDRRLEQSADGLVKMGSIAGTTHLNEVMAAMGAELSFSVHYGHYEADFRFNADDVRIEGSKKLYQGKMPTRFTFWLSKRPWDYSEELLQIPSVLHEDLFKIDPRNSCSSLANGGRRLVRKGVTR